MRIIFFEHPNMLRY